MARIGNLLHPERIGIIGVSAKRRNFGRTILENIIGSGFDKDRIVILRDGEPDPSGVRCVPDLRSVGEPLDLFIVAVGAEHVPGLVDEVLETGAARSVMLIPGGLGETEESKEVAARMIERIREAHGKGDGGPVFLGANCMGVISRPGNYDTWFIPAEKLQAARRTSWRRTAIVSQSGAFLLNRFSQAPEMSPAYLISMGNQTDLTLGDMMRHFISSDEADVIAVYAEGFKDLDGLRFAQAVREAVRNGKQVIFYKAGRTPEGKNATSGHTASLAGDYMVCENCIRQAGAIMARNFTEFQELILLAEAFRNDAVNGKRLGAVSGAGFEAVGMADSIQSDEYSMSLGAYAESTRSAMQSCINEKHLDKLVTIANPLDINPGADDEVHAHMAELMLNDEGIDAVVIGLDPHSPVTHTLAETDVEAFRMDAPGGILERLSAVRERFRKPLVAVVDGGAQFEPFRNALRERNIPVFPVCDRAIATLSLYMEARLMVKGFV